MKDPSDLMFGLNMPQVRGQGSGVNPPRSFSSAHFLKLFLQDSLEYRSDQKLESLIDVIVFVDLKTEKPTTDSSRLHLLTKIKRPLVQAARRQQENTITRFLFGSSCDSSLNS